MAHQFMSDFEADYALTTRDSMVSSPSSSCSEDSLVDSLSEDIRPHECPFPGCDRRFKRKYTLKDHIKSHTGEKPFVCPVRTCQKSFTTSGNLSRHKRLHPWLDTPLQCLVDGCGCAFANEEKLERHMMAHFGDSSMYRCEIGTCGKVFTTVGNLRRHIKQNHDDDPMINSSNTRNASVVSSTPTEVEAEPAPQPYASYPPPPPLYQRQPHAGDAGSHAGSSRQLPTDQELLEALSCLFDDVDVDMEPTPQPFSMQF